MVIEKDDTNLRVFNTAKKFAEEILFPIMESYQKFKRQSDFGSENMNDARLLSEEIKDIERYNGLKAMCDTVGSLLTAISSTVRLKGNKQENTEMQDLIIHIEKIKYIFYNSKQKFFISTYKGSEIVDTLDREYFEKIKKIVDVCYINTEILMTRNKLLFADAKEDYMDDEEIKESIRQEYVQG